MKLFNINFGILLGFFSLIGCNVLYGCPIHVINDTDRAVWIMVPEIASRIKDMTTDRAIHAAARIVQNDSDASDRDFRRYAVKFKPAEPSEKKPSSRIIGNAHDMTYVIYKQVGTTNKYVKLAQITLIACIPKRDQRMWWRKNAPTITEIQNNALNEEQSEHLRVTITRPNVLIKVLSNLLAQKPEQPEKSELEELAEEPALQEPPIIVMPEE